MEEVTKKHSIDIFAKLPIDPKLSAACDKGMIELFEGDWLDKIADVLDIE